MQPQALLPTVEMRSVFTAVTSSFPVLQMKPRADKAPAVQLQKHKDELNITTSISLCISFFNCFFLQVAPRFIRPGSRFESTDLHTWRVHWLLTTRSRRSSRPGISPLLCAALSYSHQGERNTCKNWKMSWKSKKKPGKWAQFGVLPQLVSQFCPFCACVAYHLWPGP